MIKWYCDICGNEIVKPDNPTNVSAHRSEKNRHDADFGWSGSDDIIAVFCHAKCADVLVGELKGALDVAKRVVRNNA